MDSPLLQLTQISKSFGALPALKAVSFELEASEVHALLGENGAGKSTLIKVITGAHQPDSGTIQIAGRSVRHLSPATAHRFGIACIYQQPALFPDLTVAENIGLRLEPPSAMQRVNWRERARRAAQLLHRIGANILPDAQVRQLSMPEQQLVEIACAIGAGARIVIMDEPTASLSQEEQRLLFAVVRDLRQSGVGVIYISHRLEEIFALADRVTVLRDGQTVGTRVIRRPGSSLPSDGRGVGGEDSREALAGCTHEVVGDDVTSLILSGSDQRFVTSSHSTAITASELIKLMIGREASQLYPPSECAPGEVVLSFKNLGCLVSGVHDATLELRSGEIVGLAGLMGAGRTELARVLFGITPADSGEIILSGERVAIGTPHEAVAHQVAFLPEDRRRHGVILEMSVAANLTMAIHERIFPKRWLRFEAERSLASNYIRHLGVKTSGPDAPVNSLSGGNQQKVSLARWLATKPKVLILDEPTQGVDVGAKREIHEIIRHLAREGLAVLLISSDLPEVLGMSDRVAVMREGTIVTVLPGQSDPHDVMAAALGQTAHHSQRREEAEAPSDRGSPSRSSSRFRGESVPPTRLNVIERAAARRAAVCFLTSAATTGLERYGREISVAVGLGLLLLLLAGAAPGFFQPQPLLSLLTREAPALVVSCGMALVIISRQIDISIGSQFAVCGVGAGLLAVMNWPMPLVLLASMGLGAVLGAVNGVLVAGLRLPSIVVTLATMVTWREGLRWKRQGEFVNLPDGVQWFGLSQTMGQLMLITTALVLLVVVALAARHLAGGRFIYAVGSDEEAARLAGIRPRRLTFSIFVLMGALTGLAAVMNMVQSPQVDPKSGTGLELKTIAAVVVGGVAISGGRGRLWGVFLGLLLLACVSPALTHLHVEAYWERAIQGTIILLAVVADGGGRRQAKSWTAKP